MQDDKSNRPAIARVPRAAAMTDQAPDAPYGFLRKPLEIGEHGYWPGTGKEAGRANETVLSAIFGEWDVETPDDDEDLVALKMVHTLAGSTWRGAVETIEQVRTDDDPTLNNEARLKITGKIVEPKLARLAAMAEQEFIKAAASLDQVQADITKATRHADAIDVAGHADIRAHIRAQGGGLSIATVYQAILDGDVLTLQAVATMPEYMSGLPKGHDAYTKAQAALGEAMAPGLTKRAAALRSGIAKAAHALSALDTKINRTIDLKRARQLSERAKSHG